MDIPKPDILAVDDDPAIGAALKDALKDLGGEVVIATTGDEALEILSTSGRLFAVVLLDVQMPGLEGFETALRIRQHEPPLHLPVIFLSDYPSGKNVLRGYREGGVDFLAKPFSPEILRSKVRVFIDLFLTREALAQREKFITAVTATVPEVITVYDVVERKNIFVNREIATLLGYTSGQVQEMGHSPIEGLLHPADLSDYEASLKEITRAADGEVQLHRYRVRHADGSWRWIAVRRSPFSRTPDGRLRAYAETAHDVTHQKEAEEEVHRLNEELEHRVEERSRTLGQTEERLHLLMENVANHAILTTDPAGRILEWSTGAQQVFGYSPDETVGRSFAMLFTPQEQKSGIPDQELTEARIKGESRDERWHMRKGGDKFFASGVVTALRDPAGALRGFAKICRDRTGEVLAQHALEESQRLLQMVADSLPVLIAYVGRDLRYRFNNITCEKWFGIPRDRATGLPLAEVMGEEAIEVLRPHFETVLRGEKVHFRGVVPYRRGTREVEGDFVPVANDQGEVDGFALLKSDITERAKEERRRQFLLEASTALASSPDYESNLEQVTRMAVPLLADWCAVDLLDKEGSLQRLAVAHPDPDKTRLAFEMQQRHPEHIGMDSKFGIAKVVRTGTAELASDVTDDMLKGAARNSGHLNLLRQLSPRSYLSVPLIARKNPIGALTFVSSDSRRIRYDDADLRFAEELARRIAVVIDNALLYRSVVEENARRSEAEARLTNAHLEVIRASQAKSAFLSSISHELRTPLNAIIGYTELLQEELEDGNGDRRLSEDLDRIASSGRHLLTLINDILDLSKIEAGKVALIWEEVDVAAALEEAVSMVSALAEQNRNRIEMNCPSEIGTIHSDSTRLRQIVFNLLSNAAKFTRNGVISINCRRQRDKVGTEEIELLFTDTGVGIAADEMGGLFQVFQQLDAGKSQGGTGLGLAITRLLARALGGDVTVESEPGHGSTFIVRLPTAGKEAKVPGRIGKTNASRRPKV